MAEIIRRGEYEEQVAAFRRELPLKTLVSRNNDGTLEGFAHETLPIIAVQHHPEACPGPSDSRTFFARFRRIVRESTGR